MSGINIGIIGFGTVGTGAVEIFTKNREIISSRVGTEVTVKKTADLDIEHQRSIR